MIYKYIDKLCEMLEIPAPRVRFAGDRLAEVSPSGNSIYLKKQKTCSLDQLFQIAVELRSFARRKSGKEPSDVDSNAFAAAVVASFFGVEPVFGELTFVERGKISCRRSEIVRDEFPCLKTNITHDHE